MTDFVWSVNSKWKSASSEDGFAPFWLMPASATKSFSFDLLFGTSVSEVHDLILLGRRRKLLPASLNSHLGKLSLGLSVI